MGQGYGHIIILAFPDTFVKMSDEWICKLLPWFGLGSKGYIKAGHAAQVLVDGTSGELHYFDFGRYMTRMGLGRVRSAKTDEELKIPIRAVFGDDGAISNLNEILLWLESHPERTHGKGRMLASICWDIDFQKAFNYATMLQSRGSIPYGAFGDGSNCARFVAETLLLASSNTRVKRGLKRIKLFTPSTVGNVSIGKTDGNIWEVYMGQVSFYKGSALRENLVNYFKRIKSNDLKESKVQCAPADTQRLIGIGSSAYFQISKEDLPMFHFRIKRYNDLMQLTFDGVYYSDLFDIGTNYEITYDSHCAFCHVLQNGELIRLENVGVYEQFNSWQRERSA